MRAMRIRTALCLSLLGWSVAGAAAAPAVEPDTIAGLQSLQHVTLDNGLRVLVGEPSNPALFSEVLLVVRAGTGTAPNGRDDLARISAEVLLAGRRAPEEAPVRVELARLGVSTDYTVGREVVVFRFAAPRRSTSALVRLLAELIDREPDDEAWADATARAAQDIVRRRSDPWQHGWKQLSDLVWDDGETLRPGPDTAADSAGAFRPTALADFRRGAYVPGNMVLSLWGELSIEQLITMVQEEFARLHPAVAAAALHTMPEPVRLTGRSLRCLQDAHASPAVLLVGVGAEVANDADFYGWQLVAHILGASYNSRLQHRLRTESQVVYTVEAAVIPVGARGLLLRIVGQTDQLETARHVIMEELRRLMVAAVTPDEFDFARALLRSRLRLDAVSLRDQFYRRSLVLLSHQYIRDPSQAQALLDSFTPDRLRDLLGRTLDPDEASAVVISRRREALCEARHDATP